MRMRFFQGKGLKNLLLGLLVFSAALLFVSCGGSDDIIPQTPMSTKNLTVVQLPDVVSIPNGYAFVNFDLPVDAVSMGIIIKGTDANIKLIDHQSLMFGGQIPNGSITMPGGGPLPMNFPKMADSNGVFQDFPANLFNYHAEALFFPNDGSAANAALPAGNYTFPVGALDANFYLSSDTLTPYVFYKTAPAGQETLKVRVMVVQGISPSIQTTADAIADPEISGAVNYLVSQFGNTGTGNTAIKVVPTIEVVPYPDFIDLDSEAEQNQMVSSLPLELGSDMVSIFIIGNINFLDPNVIGYSLGVPGPFNLSGTIVSGTLAEYQGDGNGTALGKILAHEFGHFMGLYHTSQTDTDALAIIGADNIADTLLCTTSQLNTPINPDSMSGCPDRNNLMFPYLSYPGSTVVISNEQDRALRMNPVVNEP